MAEENIFLFVPNLIGYGRVLLALLAFYLMPCCPWPAVCCYLLSALLDAFDGHAARALNQSTKFGAMLDMLTDRCATMCLLVNLALLYPAYTFLFQLSMTLDVASHWLHLHSSTVKGSSSHKSIDLSGNPILRIYYTSKPVLFVMCAGNELFFCLLYVLHHMEEPAGVQEQLQPAAAPVGPHRRPEEGGGGQREGGGGQSHPGGEAGGASVPAPAGAAREPRSLKRPSGSLRITSATIGMDTSWSNFLFQTPSTQSQAETPLQSELLPELTGAAQSPAPEHVVSPPSTVDTAALSEEPLPVKPLAKPSRPAHICATCNKEFKNSYNLRRHQSVHTGVRMKDRAAREKEEAAKATRAEKQTVPLSLLQLAQPAAVAAEALPQPGQLGSQQELQAVSVSIAPATVTMAAVPQPIQAAVVVVGSMEQAATGCWVSRCWTHSLCPSTDRQRQPRCQRQPGEEEPRLRGLREGVPGRLPPEPPPPVPLGREAVLLPHLPAALQEERPHELPRARAPGRRGEAVHLSALRQGLLQVRPEAAWPWPHPSHSRPSFSRPDHLNSHVRQVHSTERPFKCTVIAEASLRQRAKTARVLPPGALFLPQTCTSAFATRDRLRAHLIRHEEKVPCHICGKLLSAAYITDHMRVHNQSQHHSCHLCNRSFTTLTYLRVHAQKHHGQEWKESGGARGVFGGTRRRRACSSAGCAAFSARPTPSSRVTWAPTPTRATPVPTRPPWTPPAWPSPCPAPPLWDCW
ncbi:unnamed protein product [Tetraodon nigroviridis]|uniref:CDP-diacylglycerol--inositol 3-phosphatidyltransferase n=1 Tax=Tetraodon nigroviridis TaxID=99883 RepID=Q4T9D6_TETNG|nr:unnamed protein product [Tetraodon nigroviridis]